MFGMMNEPLRPTRAYTGRIAVFLHYGGYSAYVIMISDNQVVQYSSQSSVLEGGAKNPP